MSFQECSTTSPLPFPTRDTLGLPAGKGWKVAGEYEPFTAEKSGLHGTWEVVDDDPG
jgi:hypothetical protein